MKFISVRDIRTTPAQIWRQLSEEQEMVITNNGKPIALLTPVSDSTLEETLSAVRQARAQTAIQKLQLSAVRNGLAEMSMEEIDEEIKAFRNKNE